MCPKWEKKKQEKSPEKELSEIETSNLPDIEFKKVVIRIFKKLSENFNKGIASIKKYRNHKKELVINEE